MYWKSLVFCLALIYFPTTSSENGICTKTVSYLENYFGLDTVRHSRWDCSGWRCRESFYDFPIVKSMTRIKYKDENTCCQGYQGTPPACSPICTPSCVNATCTKPGVCTCIANHKKKNNHVCVPVCDEDCRNGTCVGVNRCSCFNGYYIPPGKKSCEPFCSFSCVNGKCSKPEECECDNGYEWDPSSKKCNPICELECINGDCTAVNECTCRQYYSKSEKNWNICQPICEPSCINSFCIDYNNCSCFENYEKDEFESNRCNPICTEMCENAECTQPDVCVCNEGYRFSKNSSNICEPVCENCHHGDCTSPGVCDCHEGYFLESEQCQPECNGCVNSLCVSPSNCECFPGFVKVNETFCADVCTEGNSTEDCVHVVEQLREHKVDDEAVLLPKNGHAITVDYSCRDFLDVCDTEQCLTNPTFECIAEKNEDTVDLRCQRGTSDFIKSSNPHLNHTFNQTVNVNLTFIFPKMKSKGNCRLCFSEDFDVPIGQAEAEIIEIFPCNVVSQVLMSQSHASTVAIVMTCFVVMGIMTGTIIIIYFKRRNIRGSLNLVTEEQLVEDDQL